MILETQLHIQKVNVWILISESVIRTNGVLEEKSQGSDVLVSWYHGQMAMYSSLQRKRES